jgi:hypothetical protein
MLYNIPSVVDISCATIGPHDNVRGGDTSTYPIFLDYPHGSHVQLRRMRLSVLSQCTHTRLSYLIRSSVMCIAREEDF